MTLEEAAARLTVVLVGIFAAALLLAGCGVAPGEPAPSDFGPLELCDPHQLTGATCPGGTHTPDGRACTTCQRAGEQVSGCLWDDWDVVCVRSCGECL